MMNSEAPAVVVDGLHVFRGPREVLPGISLTVPRGQVVGLLGPSGGGKTTLLRSIVGVQILAGGTVTVLGEPAGSPGLRSRVGYVTQDPSVYSDLTVRANHLLRCARGRAARCGRAHDGGGRPDGQRR